MRFLVGGALAFVFVALVAMRVSGPVGMLFLGGALVCGLIAVFGRADGPASAPRVSARPSARPAAASGTARTAPSSGGRAAAPSGRALWERACTRHDEVLSEYAAYELDPEMLLRFPAMWDLSSPKVIAFQDALEHAGSLRTDEYPGDAAGAQYADAVTDLRTGWYAADRYARSTGPAGLPDQDVRDLDRGLKLYRHAQSSESAERAAYLDQVVGTVDKLVDRGVLAAPPRFRAELQAQARKAIEG